MGNAPAKFVTIIGCGRVGAELATSVSRQGHIVSIVDSDERAFDRLGADYRGRTVRGEGFDYDALQRANIEKADAFATVTSSDSVNIISARVARDVYHIEHVVARVYNPTRTTLYEKLGLQTVASSSWGAQRIEQLLLHPGLQSIYTAGQGEVQIYEIAIGAEWNDRPMADLVPSGEALAAALTRGGRASLPNTQTVLKTYDILQVSATTQGIAQLRQNLGLGATRKA
ncbi:MAG: TrkA family potassium uptake protein [Chloroflexi bacterium]|nr:TrkA family potassium uptake protein [Chloroflexota bacterium]MBI3177066.1 TrkA family potassium uptake protein [Chloroflexota bacterium]MBI4314511.1 TrkA family potassium uptake protein [Chloroflexota bacterium]MBI5290922.1 TrkA family potassium uptake protein [Chloroflexota bacterium]